MEIENFDSINKLKLMEEVFNQMNVYAMVLDEKNNIMIINKKVKEVFGNIFGKKCYEVHHKSSLPPEFCAMNLINEGRPGKETFFDDAVTKKWYDTIVSKIIIGDNHFYVHLMTDVTEKHLYQEKIVDLNQTLRILNKILRHDILNNISVIMMSLELMKTDDSTLKNRAFSAINKSIELVDKMRDLESAISSGVELRPYDVNLLINELSLNHPEVKINVQGKCKVLADDALISVFNNLIRNAIIHGETDQIDVTIERDNGNCTIRFSDYGKGIPIEIRNNLFQEGIAFGKQKGMGLGLYIVQKTISRYGGKVSFEDNSPKGTAFILNLKKT